MVHVFGLLADGQVRPLLQGITEETAILSLPQGFQYHVVAAAVDNVGNMQSLESAVNNVLQVNITTVEITCLNDCSGRGSCSAIGTCQCQSGFYGSDCSQGNVCFGIGSIKFVPVEIYIVKASSIYSVVLERIICMHG